MARLRQEPRRGQGEGLEAHGPLSIDLSGPETACVKLECSIHPRYFTDDLTLLKFKGGWRVVSKTFPRRCGK
jgi:hypothetical protein